MSEVFEPVFTDAVKDVIGNDPVLDQFDTYYTANFYGTLQDSYITGAMLYDITIPPNGIPKIFETGSRGKAFNKFDANSQPPLNDTYGSAEVNRIPNLSYRLVPWKDRISNAYRLTQCFDSQERYYDSCLPDINRAFASDGAQVWTISDSPSFLLSPYANVQSASVGYMIFNGLKVDRSSSGLQNDPLVNNAWTWSYPYENKYFPQNRLTEFKEFFPEAFISTTTSSFSLQTNVKQSYEVLQEQGTYMTTYAGLNDGNLPRVQPLFRDINILAGRLGRPRKISGFLPLLPGKHGSEILGSSGRNSLRYFPTVSGSLGKISIPITSFADTRLDHTSFGFSLLIPSDVKLDTLMSHAYLPPLMTTPAPEPLTGSMTYTDTIKFLFGFGDLNNMQYGERTFIKENFTTSYSEGFETYVNGTPSKSLNDFITSDLTVRWSNSLDNLSRPQGWQVIKKTNSSLDYYPGEGFVNSYNSISGSPGGGSTLTEGLAWLSSPTNEYVLMCSGSSDNLSTLATPAASGYGNGSVASVEITSSYPWTFSYDRAVAGHTSDGLFVYFSAVPGMYWPYTTMPVTFFTPMIPIEFVRGKVTTDGGRALTKMEKFDLRSNVSKDEFPIYIQNFVGKSKLSGSTYEYPLPPGSWKLNFIYMKSGSTSPADPLTSDPDIAAIDNFQIFTWKENAFEPASTIGANNYPKFRSAKVDERFDPIKSGSASFTRDFVVTGSADYYKGLAFGISPVIRGWKYGLFSGLPAYTKTIFRRDKFGQFRDMLEQRSYTKFIKVDASPIDEDATMNGKKVKERDESDTANVSGEVLGVEKAPVEVSFVQMKYEVNDRNIGRIYAEAVTPLQTTSQNLSTEVTSSVPYSDGIARHRDENTMPDLRSN